VRTYGLEGLVVGERAEHLRLADLARLRDHGAQDTRQFRVPCTHTTFRSYFGTLPCVNRSTFKMMPRSLIFVVADEMTIGHVPTKALKLRSLMAAQSCEL
jgi:hypothetical protein